MDWLELCERHGYEFSAKTNFDEIFDNQTKAYISQFEKVQIKPPSKLRRQPENVEMKST